MDVPEPFPPIANDLRKRLSELVATLAAMITRRSNSMDDKRSRKTLKRTVGEFAEYKVPALAVEMASVSLFPQWQERVLRRVENEMVSTSDDVVLDSLAAIRVLSERVAGWCGCSRQGKGKPGTTPPFGKPDGAFAAGNRAVGNDQCGERCISNAPLDVCRRRRTIGARGASSSDWRHSCPRGQRRENR